MSSSSTTKKKRVRVWTPEDRAAHRVFEKSRREAFNDSLIDLARHIPSLTGTRRLNKHMIVDHSISRHQAQRQLCISAVQDIKALFAEKEELLAEVNRWRSASGSALPPREAKPVGQHLLDLAAVEQEIFGLFPNGFGDNVPEEGSGDDHYHEELGTDPAGTSTTPTVQLPFQDVAVTVDTREPLLSPTDDIASILELPPSSEAPKASSFVDEDLLDLNGTFGFSDLLEKPCDVNALTYHPVTLAAATDLPNFHGHLSADFPGALQDQYQHQLSFNNGMPTAHAMFGSLIHMDQPYPSESLNRQQLFTI